MSSSVTDKMQANSNAWHNTSDPAEKKRLQDENKSLGSSMGMSFNSSTGKWSGGSSSGNGSDILNNAFSQYQNQMNGAQNAQNSAIDASIQQAIKQLNNQKTSVVDAGKQSNTAAYDAMMQANNPYGAQAEGLAARGLNNSGVSESSKISVGNTYQTALNTNKNNVNKQLNDIDLAIENAQLTGDIQKAESLANIQQQIANAGLTNANNILSANQWDKTHNYNVLQNAQNYARGIYESDRAFAQDKLLTDEQIRSIAIQNAIDEIWGKKTAEAQYNGLLLNNNSVEIANAINQSNLKKNNSVGSSSRSGSKSSYKSSGSGTVSKSSNNIVSTLKSDIETAGNTDEAYRILLDVKSQISQEEYNELFKYYNQLKSNGKLKNVSSIGSWNTDLMKDFRGL